jgi:hypothetical protein
MREWKGGRPDGGAPPDPAWGGVGAAEFASRGRERVRPPGVWQEGRRVVRAVVSSCPERWEQWGGGGRGDWEGGAGVSRKGETKEPSADCHLRVTGSAPPLLPFFPLFLQLWASESALCAQMLGFSSPVPGRSVGAPRTGGVPTWSPGCRA